MAADGDCPCGRAAARGRRLAYAGCCGRFVEDFEGTPAPDAESLMRSRYTAFVLRRAGYLLATWHPSTRPAALDFEPGLQWLGLQVKAHLQADASHAQVEFVARMRHASGRASRLAERSRFVREGGRWYYVDGPQR
ncbi:MAG: YchJ family metal-binding protein [Xenophilus sp.]